jgi:hypothetical protein
MSERQRYHDNDQPPSGGGDASGGGGSLGELRRAGEDLLAAGDEAIRKALSGDSEAFLRSSRQEGGQ